MKTFLLTDESRASPNDPDGLTKGWVFNGDSWATGIRRQQIGSVVKIWGGMIGNKAYFPLGDFVKRIRQGDWLAKKFAANK